MADERTFTLVGVFKDNITPSLKKLNTQLASTAKSFEKMQRMVRPIARDMAIMGDAASRMTSGIGSQRNAFESNLRAMKGYRSELGKISSAQRQMERKFKVPAAPFAPTPSGPRGGGGRPSRPPVTPRSYAPEMGDGFTIEKGILANLATSFVEGLFTQITGAVGKAINYVKGALQERIQDEMSDIQSAGGILSIGKERNVAWADTYKEAMGIQNKLNAEMANLAAALPGDTQDYVNNMKQVTDTTMKITLQNGPAMIQAMKGFNSSVVTQKDAYIEATKQLAKYTTLGSLGATGGVPITALAEQILNMDKVNIQSMKRKFAQLQKNPLLSGALEKFEGEMNKASAGSADRYKAMIKAFEQAFPAEVLDAMTNSADGIIQSLKSGLLNPDVGLLGLGRKIKISFAGLNRSLGPLQEDLSVFDMFLGVFKAFGMVVSPIISELPKIIEPFSSLLDPLKQFYVIAENTIGKFKTETQRFQGMKLDFAAFRGSLSAIGNLAKAFGADKAEIDKLDSMLTSKKLDLGGALQQAFKTLFSSDALKKFGKAIGESLSGFLSMLANMAKTGGQLADQSGLIGGFLEGWKKNKGTEALLTIVKEIIGVVVKAVVAAGFEIATTDPISAAVVATLFIAPLRAKMLDFLKMFFTRSTASIGTGLARGAAGLQGPMQSAAATQAVGIGGRIRESFSGTLAGRAGSRLQQFAQNRMPGTMAAGGRFGARMAAFGGKAAGLGKMMGGVGAGATALTAITGALDSLSKVGDLDSQINDLNERMTEAANIGDVATVAQLQKEKEQVKKQRGEEVASGVGGTVGAVAGGALGAAVAGPIGAMIGAQLGQAIGTKFGPAIGNWWNSGPGPALSKGWASFTSGIQGLGQNISSGFTSFISNIQSFFSTLPATISKTFNNVVTTLTGAFAKFDALFGGLPGKILGALKTVFSPWTSLLGMIRDGILRVAGIIGNLKWPSWLPGGGGNQQPAPSKPVGSGKGGVTKPAGGRAKPKFDGQPKPTSPLHQAISTEMRNKPPGSDLVIANSSETVIPAFKGLNLDRVAATPAANGYGTRELLTTLNDGFNNTRTTFERVSEGINTNRQDMVAGFTQSEQKNTERANATNSKISKYQLTTSNQIAGITQNVASLAAQVKQMASFGAMGGGMAGGGGAGGMGGGGTATGSGYGGAGSKIAGALGTYIKQTGGAPGSIHEHPQHGGVKGKHSPNSYHYQGRAIDIGAYANEQAGVMARIAQFNAKNGVKPVEWLHAKNAGGHNDHVHVAYAYGQGNPALFSSKQAAQKFEKSMVPSSVRVGSITGNSAEGFGGSTSVTNNITIQQQPGQSADDLAMIVAQKIGEAVADARAASILV
jgi:hypothetical protein